MDGIPAARLVAEIGVDGETAASASLSRFGAKVEETSVKQSAGFARVGVAAKAADRELASFGVPFAGVAGRMVSSIDQIEGHSKSLGSTLSNLGRAEATAAVVGLAAVATEGVHLADALETAHARLEVAVKNSGGQFDKYGPQIDATDKAMEKLGFTNADTESSLANLTNATHSIAKAQQDESLAADIAAGRHIDLTSATTILMKVETGHVALLGRLGISVKDASGHIISQEEALRRLSAMYGGQAAAAADTFAGKQKILSAELQDLGAVVGEAVVPKLLSLANGTVAGVHGFESLNAATGGWTGKILLAGAAVPVLVFAGEKVVSGAKAIGDAYSTVGNVLHTFTTGTAAAAAGSDIAAVADARLTIARQVEATATAEVAATTTALTEALAANAIAEAGDAAAAGAVVGAADAAAVAQANLAIASKGVTAATVTQAAGMGGLAVGAGALVGSLLLLGYTYQGVKKDTNDNVVSLHGYTDSVVRFASYLPMVGSEVNFFGHALGLIDNAHKNNTTSTKADSIATLEDAKAKAVAALAADFLAGRTSKLAGDKAAVAAVSQRLAGVENVVTAATNQGAAAAFGAADAVNTSAAAANSGAFAYLGLASSVTTAAGAFDAIAGQVAGAGSPYKLQLDTNAAQASADALHGKLDAAASGGGGGGGAGQTATAAALDQRSKELALRDARVGVKTATTGVEDAELNLVQARQANATAVTTLRTAEENYRTTLHGVAADTKTARDALDALTTARNAAENQALNEADAKRSLAQAKNNRQLSGFGVTDAQTTLTASTAADTTAQTATAAAEKNLSDLRVSGTADATALAAAEQAVTDARTAELPLHEQMVKDEVALANARIDASKGDEDVTRAELALSDQRIASKQKTTDLNVAQRTLTDTLHGYPPKSAEAKAATLTLRDAQVQARGATDQVTHATEGLVTAQNAIPTAALAAERAQADLDGKLTAAAGAGGGMAKLKTTAGDLITRLDDLQQKTKAVAFDIGHNIAVATGSVGAGFEATIGALRAAVDAEPLLAGAFDTVIAQLQANIAKALADVSAKYAKTGQSVVPGGFGHQVLSGSPPTHASGGNIAAGEFGIVGDLAGQGGEIVQGLHGGGAHVYTHMESIDLVGPRGGPGSDPRLLSEVQRMNANIEKLYQALAKQRPTTHIDTINAMSRPEQIREELDRRDRHAYMLATF